MNKFSKLEIYTVIYNLNNEYNSSQIDELSLGYQMNFKKLFAHQFSK